MEKKFCFFGVMAFALVFFASCGNDFLISPESTQAVGSGQTVKAVEEDWAEFTSQSIPTYMEVGQTVTISITMKNIGTTTWTMATKIKLGSQSPNGNTTWGRNRVELSASDAISTGQFKTFTFAITAPSTPGTYSCQWGMLREQVAWFGDSTPNVVVTVGPVTDNAQFVSQTVPTSILPGGTATACITLKNTGTTTWLSGTPCYKLGSQNPAGNYNWGINRVLLSDTDAIMPGQTKTFCFTITAPATRGVYNFQWRMLIEKVRWFGATTPNIPITVGSVTDSAQFYSQSVPTTVSVGQSFNVSVTMFNIGSSTWTKAARYRLGSQNPQDNGTWAVGRVELSDTDAITPQTWKTFYFTVKAPSTPGAYNFQWRMLIEGYYWFGAYTPNVIITVH